jgi:hypothetical protein
MVHEGHRDRLRPFPIVLVGNQITDCERLVPVLSAQGCGRQIVCSVLGRTASWALLRPESLPA